MEQDNISDELGAAVFGGNAASNIRERVNKSSEPVDYGTLAEAYRALGLVTTRMWRTVRPRKPEAGNLDSDWNKPRCACPKGLACKSPGAHRAPAETPDRLVQAALSPKQSGAIVFLVRNEDLLELRALRAGTMRIELDDYRLAIIYRDPDQEMKGGVDAAEKKAEEQRERAASVPRNVTAKLDEHGKEICRLVGERQWARVSELAHAAHANACQYEQIEMNLRIELQAAERELAEAKQLESALGRGIAYRVLDRNFCPVDDTPIPLPNGGRGPKWANGTAMQPLPFELIEHVVRPLLPDVGAWVSDKFEVLEEGEPNSRGLSAAELHALYLRDHNLKSWHCTDNVFGRMTTDAGIPKPKLGDGVHTRLRLKRTVAQREAELRAQFEAERRAREQAEFEAWRKQQMATAGDGVAQ